MKTYQDYQDAKDKIGFLRLAINEYITSFEYQSAITAQKYYQTQNTEITKRLGYLERQTNQMNVKFHKIKNCFFPREIKKLVFYLTGNGIGISPEAKEIIDKKLDKKLTIASINACIDGVSWCFSGLNNVVFFRSTEFFPLLDERVGTIKAGVRFWRISADKPLNVEFYEIDGMTGLVEGTNGLQIISPKESYRKKVIKDKISIKTLSSENYEVLPIFPLYANEVKKSELSDGLKSLIDAWDFISSDLVDGITLIEGIYWIIKNYGGETTHELLREIQELKATLVDGDADAGVTSTTVETPYNAKQATLDLLEKQMYKCFLSPNPEHSMTAVTATEFDIVNGDIDIKADILEWNIIDVIENILMIKGINEPVKNFKRRTNRNDSQTISNITAQIMGGWIDEEQAIKLDPTIAEEDKDELLKRVQLKLSGYPKEEDELNG